MQQDGGAYCMKIVNGLRILYLQNERESDMG